MTYICLCLNTGIDECVQQRVWGCIFSFLTGLVHTYHIYRTTQRNEKCEATLKVRYLPNILNQ